MRALERHRARGTSGTGYAHHAMARRSLDRFRCRKGAPRKWRQRVRECGGKMSQRYSMDNINGTDDVYKAK